VTTVAGAFRLTDAGTTQVTALLDADRRAVGAVAATAALDAFVELDRRLKDCVTAWQLRDSATQVLNDHADVTYDAAVLDRLAALHADANTWLEPLRIDCPRLGDYADRLDRALAATRSGDNRFVASPRVDSYHGIWFELHEDLIQLAGRTREAEVAAGRA
jgi:pyruvate,orthophosphate dikinase